MSSQQAVKVFIGSGEASLLERKVLIYSLHQNSTGPVDIYVFNGTHNAVEHNDEPPFAAPMSLRVKYLNATEFSLYRFLIPQLCGHKGRAIYLDSDMICLGDINTLRDTPLHGRHFLAKQEAYPEKGEHLWGLSVMLIDCERARFDLETYCDEIGNGDYGYRDLLCMGPAFLERHPYEIGELEPRWNEFDAFDKETQLIHYTNLFTQPWKAPDHPYGELWFRYLQEARDAGYVTDQDILRTKKRAYVRQDILEGNSPRRKKKRKGFLFG